MTHSLDILYVVTKANWGGAQRYVYDLAVAMNKRGKRVAVAYGEPGLLVERLSEAGILTIQVPSLGRDARIGKDLISLFEMRSLFAKMRPRVVHLNSSKAGFVGALAARMLGIKRIVFTAHGWAFTEPRGALTRTFFKVIQRWTAQLSHTVIAVSGFIEEQTRGWSLPENRVKIIPHGISEPAFLSREEARKKLRAIDPSLPTDNSLWVGTVAELHPNKGLDIGMYAWSELEANAHWVLIGGGQEREHLVTLKGDDATVHLLGFLPDASTYLKAFDLFMLPSRTEALGYVLIEAGYAGVPVLTNGIGGTKEVVPASYTLGGYFTPEDPESLRKHLEEAIDSKDLLPELGEKLRTFVHTEFSLERMIEDTIRAYD